MNNKKVKSAVTVSLVEEARGGPFVFWNGLADAFEHAARLGFDAVEIFAPGPEAVDHDELKQLISGHGVAVAAVGTGAGMVRHGLSLTDPAPSRRQQAIDFVKSMIDLGADYKAPAIIGSMQGKWGGDLSREAALGLLQEALNQLGQHAAECGVPIFYEPLNRYETNLLKTIAESVEFLKTLDSDRILLLADLFHMNIEETDIAEALRTGRKHIGHIHFVDSNRQAAGLGHMQYEPIISAIREIDFCGYLSAEAFPIPDSLAAAQQTIETFKRYF
jgi:sugar phosphate isomerase/epimerase